MNLKLEEEEILVAERDFDSIFSYTAGRVRSKFLTELRDNKKIIGTKCHNCNMVWVPARSTCLKCFERLDEFVPVGNTGTVMTFSIINTYRDFYPKKAPFVYAIIQLEGADTGIVHLLDGIDPQGVKIGMKVQPIFKQQRVGSILDIQHFEPVIS